MSIKIFDVLYGFVFKAHKIDLFFDSRRYHFGRDSFERFGDDLTEVLFSYLSFKDKFRFECLSKQIQRLVFNSVSDLLVYYRAGLSLDSVLTTNRRVDLKVLESVLKKCPKIKAIEVLSEDIEEEVDLLIKYCNHLNEIKLDFDKLSDQLIDKFCLKFGPKLKRIHFKTNNELIIKTMLKNCPKVEEFDGFMIDYEDIFDGNEVLVKNLTSFRFYYSDSDIERMRRIAENNKRSLQSIEVILAEEVGEQQIKDFFEVVLMLKEIRRLKAYFASDCISVLLEEFLINLSEKCPKLTRIEIDMAFDELTHILRVFNAFNSFKRLRALKFSNFSRKVSSSLVGHTLPCSFITQSLKDCHQLTELSIDGNNISLGEEFMESVVRHSPKLQLIWCSNVDITEKTVNCLHGLSDLLSVTLLTNRENNISNESVVNLTKKCPKIKSISLSFSGSRYELRDTDIQIVRQTNGFETQGSVL